MKGCITFKENIDDFEEIDVRNINPTKTFCDKFYKIILLDNFGNFRVIKAIEKREKLNLNGQNEIIVNSKIGQNSPTISRKEIEKNIKIYNGIIISFDFIDKEKKINSVLEFINKIDKNYLKGKYFPKILLGDKCEFFNFINNNKSKEKKVLDKIRNIKFLDSEEDTNISIKKAVEEIIKMKETYIDYSLFIKRNAINERNFINRMNKSKLKLMKCYKCNKIFEITIDNYSNLIHFDCKECNNKIKFDILEFGNLTRYLNCYECKADINENSSINYCFNCKKSICEKCVESHFQKEERLNTRDKATIIKYQNNILDSFCTEHDKIYYKYCKSCKDKKICIECELNSHLNHEKREFDNGEIMRLISRKNKNLQIEKENLEKLKIILTDCVNSLNNYFNLLISYRVEGIKLKEKIIQELEFYKFDKALIKNLKHLKFQDDNSKMYDYNASWEEKLNNIFNVFNEPIKIEKTELLLMKENIKGPFDTLNQTQLSFRETLINEKKENITDLCFLHNFDDKNYFAVSYSSGLLKIYKDDFDKFPVKTISEFEEKIQFLYKSFGNTIIVVGNSKIKHIDLSDNCKEYNIISEIEIKNENNNIFKMAFDFQSLNSLLTLNSSNELIFYNAINGETTSNITNCLEIEENREISYIDKISENIIILHYQNCSDLLELNKEKRSIVGLDTEENENNNNINSLIIQNKFPDKIPVEENWRIIEFTKKDNNISIKNNYLFNSNIYYLGKINEKMILLFNNSLRNLNVFNLVSYTNISEISFNYSHNPLISFELNRRRDIYDLLLFCKEEALVHFSLNLTSQKIQLIEEMKFEDNNKISNPELKVNNKIKEVENNIVKIINIDHGSLLFLNKEQYIYNLQHSNK